MALRKERETEESDLGPPPMQLHDEPKKSTTKPEMLREESRRKLMSGGGDGTRRSRFKDRARQIEPGALTRGVSAPSIIVGDAKAPLPLSSQETLSVGLGMGHDFQKKTYYQPTYCHQCAELLWGLRGQGFQCKVCNFVAHEKCIPYMMVPCRHVLVQRIQEPVPHKWNKPDTPKKRKWCNVCRKKIHGQAVSCEVCKYYAHPACKENAFNNCKQCATYNAGAVKTSVHHWIEGNLPNSARCEFCTKSCSTTEALSGFRCGWCGISVHSSCLEKLELKMGNDSCTYRDLYHMMLTPRAITYRLSVSSRDATTPGDSATTPVAEGDDDEDNDASGGEEDEEDEYGKRGRPIVVIDGSGHTAFKKWRKTTVHPWHVDKYMSAEEVLSISLRKCGIATDPSGYYLAEITDSSTGTERAVGASECPYSIKHTGGWGPLKLYIRAKETIQKEGFLKVNNSLLESAIKTVSVLVTATSSAHNIVKDALIKFDLEDAVASDYCLMEVSQMQGVLERILRDDECPWQHVQDIRKDSLTVSFLQRYYLRHREGGVTSFFIHGVKKDSLRDKQSSMDHFKKLLSEAPAHLVPSDIPYDRIIIQAFPTGGILCVELPTFDLAMHISAALEESSSLPKLCMLPTIYPDIVGMDQEPVLVFINGRSGGNQGVKLLSAFKRHLNPFQVFDLAQGGPLPGLYAFRQVPSFRILIGGGDGTFGWVLGALQEAKEFLTCKRPPCALVPLGTGNDLARALKWGGGYSGEKVMHLLLAVEDSDVVDFDRWDLSFKEDPSLEKAAKGNTKPVADLEPHSIVMNNYCGIGLDAAIALDFHLAREENPEKFSSRFHNKGVYLQLGLQKMIKKTEISNLRRILRIHCDGKLVDIPEVEGVVFLNIQSWGAGSDGWGTDKDSHFAPATYDDGLLEVIGLSGMMHMGQIQSGIRSGIRMAQGHQFKVEFLATLPVQVDGEACPQPPGTLTINLLPEKAVMLQGGTKKFYSHQLSKKEEKKKISLSAQLSEPSAHLSGGMSSRRTAAAPRPLLEEEEGTGE